MNPPVRSARRIFAAAVFSLLCLAPLTSQAQIPRITEFMADNRSGITDEDGTPQGWIEVWNSTTVSAALANYRLTNGSVVWAFPAATLLPDERILVWASGKNRRVSTAPLHTSFTLSASGGTLKLTNASGTPFSEFTYPPQDPDISWGRDETDNASVPTLTGAYTVPTPGARNSYDGSTVAQPVYFSHPSQTFTTSISLTLSLAEPDPDTVIRYTTNRTVPTPTSTEYTGEPLNVTGTTMVRARAFKNGLLPGATETQAYLRLGTTTQTFTSTMPVVVVSNFLGTAPPDTKAEQPAYLWAWEPAEGGTVSIMDPPTYTSRVRINRRGSSTLTNAKYNLDMETRNAWNDDENEFPFLSMPTHSDWVLSGPFDFDRSLIQNPFIFALSRSIGRYAPRHRMAEVFLEVNGGTLNSTGTNSTSNDYYGVYNILEKIRRNAERMNISKMETYDNGPSAKTGGFIWKVDRADADEAFSAGGVPGSGNGMAWYYPKGPEMKSPQRDPQEQYLIKYLNDFRTALAAGNKNPVTGWPAYLDQTATIDHHLMVVWAMCTDALRLSAYWQKDRGGKMAAGPLWDFDRAFASTDGRSAGWVTRVTANRANGTWRSPSDDYGTDWFNTSSDSTGIQTPIWWHLLFRDPDFYQNYIDRWQELRRGPFSGTAVNDLIDSINAPISAEAVTRDVARWGKTKRAWRSPFTNVQTAASQTAEIIRLKDFVKLRADFMDSQWVGPVSASAPGGATAPGTEITLTGPAGAVIYYTVDGTDPRPSGGAAPTLPGVTLYEGPVTINSTTRLRARAYKESHTALTGLNKPTAGLNNPPLLSKWSGLLDTRYSTDPPAAEGSLMITEINFNPPGPTAAELETNPGWTDNDFEFVELRNKSAAAVDLTGVSFTVGVTFTIPATAEISLAPGGCAIVASNPAAFRVRYGASFSAPVTGPWEGNLSNGGEKLSVAGVSGLQIVSVTYDDAWSPEADGGGRSLVIHDQDVANYAVKENWRPSARLLGSPGAIDPMGVIAGADVTGPFSSALSLKGLAAGSKPASAPTYSWTKTEGPGDAVFSAPNALVSNVTVSAPGVYTLRLTAADSAATAFEELTLYAGDTADAWLARHPGLALTDDPDGDGRNNLLEYALGTDPSAVTPGEPPLTDVEYGHLTITFPRPRPPADVTLTLQVSEDASEFRDADPSEFMEKVIGENVLTQTVKFTDLAPLSAGPRRYVRLKVTQP